jgi:hypothetical protein
MRLDNVRQPWTEAQIERAAQDIEDGINVLIIAKRMTCSNDRVRKVMIAAKGKDWWAKHVPPTGRRFGPCM